MAATSYDEMSEPDLRKAIQKIESDVVAPARKEQQAMHDVAERKLKLKPLIATATDQVLKLGPSIIDQLKALPPELFNQAKDFFSKGGK
jgi:hypothetical protein